MVRKKKFKPRFYYFEYDMIEAIHKRTGVAKIKIKKILRVFNVSFFEYLMGNITKPLKVTGVFIIYKKLFIRENDEDMLANWRKSEQDLPYKK